MTGARKKKVGLKDIAAHADVAMSTVSHVLNGTAPISDDVRNRVLEAARQLGYLNQKRAKASISVLNTLLLVLPDDIVLERESNYFSLTILKTLRSDCEARGIQVVPFSGGEGGITADRVLAAGRAAGVDGILIFYDDRQELLQDLGLSGLPVVLINGEDPEMHIDSVTPGNRFAARKATSWLISLGHRRMLHITWDGRSTIRRRGDGFLDAFRSAGLPLQDARTLVLDSYMPAAGEAAIRKWVSENDGLGGVTAIFCAADNLALGVMRGLQALGFSVPADVSICGFDAMALAELSTPPLSTVSVPLDQIGPAALDLLEQRLVAGSDEHAAHRLELGCELVPRESVRRN